MKDSLLESLKRLLINSIDPKNSIDMQSSTDNIQQHESISHQTKHIKKASSKSIRVLNIDELLRFDEDSLNYIYFLKQIGLLSSQHRECLLNQLLDLEQENITCNDIKWCLLSLIAPDITKEQQIFLDFVLEQKANTSEH